MKNTIGSEASFVEYSREICDNKIESYKKKIGLSEMICTGEYNCTCKCPAMFRTIAIENYKRLKNASKN